MDFSWSDEQLALRQEVAAFADAELNVDLATRDRDGIFRRDLWERCAQFGILGYAAPKAYGGGPEMDLMTAILAMEGLGYGCRDNGLAFGLNTALWAVQHPILEFGTEDQKQRFLPGLCDGSVIGAHALTEPTSGSDAYSLQMRAERCDGGYRLTGTKRLITFGPIADLALVYATLDPALGNWGITAFLVEADTPGYTASPVQSKMGLRTIPIGELVFEDCFVPEENRLGPEGAGVSLSNHGLEIERCSILASQLGAMDRQLDDAIGQAKTREQFGQPIGKFQSVSNRIVDMKLRLETARLLLYKVAWLKMNQKPAMLEAALLKLHLSEGFVSSSLDAIRIHGGNGYLTEFGVERDLRDAIGGTLYAGTSDIQRTLAARLLGL
ncbi:MAG: acyl-CoA dehydrogenase family protein [Rubricoccaceae bacterium]